MSVYRSESLSEAREVAQRIVSESESCACADNAHQNAMHDLAHDLVDLIAPVGMRADGSADPRVEAGMVALRALGVPTQRAWDYADAVLRTYIEAES